MTLELVCISTAECRPALLQPFEEGRLPERGLMRGEQPAGQAANFLGGEDYVAHHNAERTR